VVEGVPLPPVERLPKRLRVVDVAIVAALLPAAVDEPDRNGHLFKKKIGKVGYSDENIVQEN